MRFLKYIGVIYLLISVAGCLSPSSTLNNKIVKRAQPSRNETQKKIDELTTLTEQDLDSDQIEKAVADVNQALKLCDQYHDPGAVSKASIAYLHNLLGMIWLRRSMRYGTSGNSTNAKICHRKGISEFKTALQIDPGCEKAQENLQAFGPLEIK